VKLLFRTELRTSEKTIRGRQNKIRRADKDTGRFPFFWPTSNLMVMIIITAMGTSQVNSTTGDVLIDTCRGEMSETHQKGNGGLLLLISKRNLSTRCTPPSRKKFFSCSTLCLILSRRPIAAIMLPPTPLLATPQPSETQ
jgi:hypothetical protein